MGFCLLKRSNINMIVCRSIPKNLIYSHEVEITKIKVLLMVREREITDSLKRN